ncbi:DUF6777 domain-containing protein [Streptomyces gamaensis]|uniref:DUF6777 domain-containing protein n=1 Tax=Streptomyces gamaensis TaxID=1763542 RepID=A0ABW0Z5K2_9ACTN
MTSEPPSEQGPTGPPSGPLAGHGGGPSSGAPEPTRPDWPSTPPGAPAAPGGPGRPGGTGEPSGPPPGEPPGGGQGRWWSSAPRVALLLGALVAAAALTIFFLRQSGAGAGEVYLQPATADGQDPFTRSTAQGYSASAAQAAPGTPPSPGAGRTVPGSTPGLYGGSYSAPSCDVERQIGYLTADGSKANAFAGALGIEPAQIPGYVRALTSVQLRLDTRVTDHGFKDGAATGFQAVLQKGTAVLVDDRGMPRVRCACGDPLGPPSPANGTPKARGGGWDSYRWENTVAVTPADAPLTALTLYDPTSGRWFERPAGGTGDTDRAVSRPGTGSSQSSAPGTPPPNTSPSTGGGYSTPPASSPSAPPATPVTPTPPTAPPPPAYGPAHR